MYRDQRDSHNLCAMPHKSYGLKFLKRVRDAENEISVEPPDVAEAKTNTLCKSIAEESRRAWEKPAASIDDVKHRAEITAYWNGASLNDNDELYIDGLHSKHLDKRSVAELIVATLALTEFSLFVCSMNYIHCVAA